MCLSRMSSENEKIQIPTVISVTTSFPRYARHCMAHILGPTQDAFTSYSRTTSWRRQRSSGSRTWNLMQTATETCLPYENITVERAMQVDTLQLLNEWGKVCITRMKGLSHLASFLIECRRCLTFTKKKGRSSLKMPSCVNSSSGSNTLNSKTPSKL